MELTDFLRPDGVIAALKAASKRQALGELAARGAVIAGADERAILDTLLQREKLGSTGIGGGIAIPHGKLPGLERIHGVFARASQPIDFEAVDDQPVDLLFLLLAPEGAGADHLKALARIARILREPGMTERLRAAPDAAALFAALTDGGSEPAMRARAAAG